MALSPPGLSQIQLDFLTCWFEQTSDFFLTGGAALVVACEVPRITKDLDLFTASTEALQHVEKLVEHVARAIGADSTSLRTAPYFRRYKVSRFSATTLVDLVADPVSPIYPSKLKRGTFIVDPPEEILVNKICAIVGRGEGRDFVDAYFLSSLGFDIEVALLAANQKDGGVDASSLLYVLSDIDWSRFQVPDIEPELVRATATFFDNWAESMARRLFPEPEGR